MGAAGLTAADRNAIKHAFDVFDTNNNGSISKDEFKAAMKNEGIVVNDRTFDLVFHIVDCDRSGSIEIKEFGKFFVMLANCGEKNQDLYDLMAIAADLNGDGKISKKERMIVCENLAEKTSSAATKLLSDSDLGVEEFVTLVKQTIK